ncbi:MAG: hypothetical protein E6Q97_39390 [Desulfurellales bacterium]|nr:MAG: hypothetical protein E6Q97_39390 [Desulfurellales bacterium]
MGILNKLRKIRDGIRKGVAVADDMKPVIGIVAPKVVTDAIGVADEMVNAEAVIEGQVTETVKKVKGKK